ncbi:HIT-like domain-containing protein, partial [Zopfochytrium polystomum]
ADDLYIKTIHPCTLAHIRSALPSTTHILRETAATYRSVVEPYIASIPASRTAWVRDILSGKAEADDALFSDVGANGENGAASANDDGGFVVVPDIKWDQRTARGLYVQVIVGEAAVVRRGGARCLRDLRAHHLPLLRRIRATVMDVVPKRYPSMVAAPTQLRLLVHYLPSYYHLHVHVVHADYDGSGGGGGAGGGGGLLAGRAHLLDDVIAHLEMDGDWYAKADLFVAVPESHDLFRPLMEAER